MKKIIIAANIIFAIAAIMWFIFVKRPAFLNQLFPQTTANKSDAVSSNLNEPLNGLNPYEEAYTNPFK